MPTNVAESFRGLRDDEEELRVMFGCAVLFTGIDILPVVMQSVVFPVQFAEILMLLTGSVIMYRPSKSCDTAPDP